MSRDATIAALRRLANWTPGFPKRCPLAYADCYDEETEREERQRADDAPLFSEAYLYELLGKEEARVGLALLSNVCRAIGLSSYHDLDREPPPERQTVAVRRMSRKAAIAAARRASSMTRNDEGWIVIYDGRMLPPVNFWEAKKRLQAWRTRRTVAFLTGVPDDELPPWIDRLWGALEERVREAMDRLRKESYA